MAARGTIEFRNDTFLRFCRGRLSWRPAGEYMIRMLAHDELEDAGVYEFAYAENGDRQRYWSEGSFYLNWGAQENSIASLAPYILKVLPEFEPYGSNKVTIDQWERIRVLAASDPERDPTLDDFFLSVERWLENGNGGAGYFWIFGP